MGPFNPSHRPSHFTLPPISATSVSGVTGLQTKYKEVRTGSSSRYSVSGPSFTSGSGKSIAPRIQRSGDSNTSQQTFLPVSFDASTGVPVYGFTQFGFMSNPIGSSTSETITTTFSCFRSDKPVYTTALI